MNTTSKTEVTWIPPDHCRELAGYKVSATSTDGAEVWKGKVESTATSVLIGGLDPAVVKAGGYKFAVAAVDHTGGRTFVVRTYVLTFKVTGQCPKHLIILYYSDPKRPPSQ